MPELNAEQLANLAKMGINVKGGVHVGRKIIEGDQVNVITGQEAEEAISKFRVKMEKGARDGSLVLEEGQEFTPEKAPEEIYSDDFVSGKIIQNGVTYKLDRSTIDQEGNYRYKKVI